MNKIHFLNTRFVAGCLVVSMVCGMLPVTAYADETPDEEIPEIVEQDNETLEEQYTKHDEVPASYTADGTREYYTDDEGV